MSRIMSLKRVVAPISSGRCSSRHIRARSTRIPEISNGVRGDGDKINVWWERNNRKPHRELVRRMKRAVHRAGHPFVFTERMGIETNSHQCGTAVAGVDPATSVLNADCRAHDVDTLRLVDSSFFPPQPPSTRPLTIAANAIRVAPVIAKS